jgi:hypothetical protein
VSGYARNTSVPVERSRAEIERTLSKYGATRFGTMTEPDGATIYFEHKGRQIQLRVPMPPRTDKQFTQGRSSWRTVANSKRDQRYEQEYRRRWRVLLITVKAMLEAVDSKVLTFDQAFLAHIVIPGTAKTLGDALLPRLDALHASGLKALLAENPE